MSAQKQVIIKDHKYTRNIFCQKKISYSNSMRTVVGFIFDTQIITHSGRSLILHCIVNFVMLHFLSLLTKMRILDAHPKCASSVNV